MYKVKYTLFIMERYIAICQPYNKYIHGQTQDSNPYINRHFMVEEIVYIEEFYNNLYRYSIQQLSFLNANRRIPIPTLEIIEPIELSSGESVACIKTFWLRIIQRKWRKVFEKRKREFNKLKNLNNFLNRQKYGI
jgi:hypothetical protein